MVLLVSMKFHFLFDINDSDPSCLFSNQKSFAPFYATYVTFNKFLGLVSFCGPDVDCVIENNTYHVLLAPVEQICIEIVL